MKAWIKSVFVCDEEPCEAMVDGSILVVDDMSPVLAMIGAGGGPRISHVKIPTLVDGWRFDPGTVTAPARVMCPKHASMVPSPEGRKVAT